MFYIASFRERKGVFDKAFVLEDGEKFGRVEITNDARGKKKFVKRFSGEAIFAPSFLGDEVIGPRLMAVKSDGARLLVPHVPAMLSEAVLFAKKALPLGEAAVFAHGDEAEEIAEMLVPLARLITVVGESREGRGMAGTHIRYVEKLKRAPDAAVALEKCTLPPNVPLIDIGGLSERGRYTITRGTVSFCVPSFLSFWGETALSCDSAAYLLEKGCDFEPKIQSFRKKCAPLLTFC